MIKGNPNSSWQRKHIAFVGGFNINNDADADKFDNLIDGDEGKKT
jgi:hypothetical protein